jgi:hypothetical protein
LTLSCSEATPKKPRLGCATANHVRELTDETDGAPPMANQRDLDRQNDMRLLTPLLLMATILAFGILVYAITGHALAAGA